MHLSQLISWLQNKHQLNNSNDDDDDDDDDKCPFVSWTRMKNRKVAKFFPIQVTILTQSLHITDVIQLQIKTSVAF